MAVTEQKAKLSVVSSVRAYVRYGDGTWSGRLRDQVEARWEIFEAIDKCKLTMAEAVALAVMVSDSALDYGDQASQAYLVTRALAEREKLIKEGLLMAPALVLLVVPATAPKKRELVNLEPSDFDPRSYNQN